MAGRLIYVMGPSGSGKDTLLQGLARRMGSRAYLAPRVITREADRGVNGALPVSMQEFLQMEAAGVLALSWRANGYAYGILQHINDRLAAGKDVLVNGSRAYLPTALLRYRELVPVMLQVEPGVLHDRLRRRGRETEAQIQARLARNTILDVMPAAVASSVLCIDNSRTPEDAVQSLYIQLEHRMQTSSRRLCV